MPLTVEDILTFDSLIEGKLIGGLEGLGKEVTGIMVMEAPDIDVWGSHGQVILTSFFALKDLSEEETKQFFIKANDVGISALIVKMDRLVQLIPEHFIEECNFFNIPLIKIQKKTKYEAIILEVMETLINKNKVLLDHYYDINHVLTKMALEEPSLIDILLFIERLIQKPVTLLKNHTVYISTNKALDKFQTIRTTSLPKTRYTQFEYQKQYVYYQNPEMNDEKTILVVDIPTLGENTYKLIIHELNQTTSEKNFMAIENTVSFLQMEFLKKYALQQQNLSHLNEIINDLIYGRYQSVDELKETLNYLKFHEEDVFNIVVVDVYEDHNIKNKKWEDTTSIAKELSNYIKLHWKKYIYLVKKDKIIFLISNTDSDKKIKENVMTAIKSLTGITHFSKLILNTGISNKANIFDLPIAYKQAYNLLKLLRKAHHKNRVISYKEIGVFQIFLESNKVENLIHFVPDKLLDLQKQNPELVKTLKVFLDHNQNFKITAEKLFIHPKTAKYRIERVMQLTQINFDNAEELLQINVGLRLLEFLNTTDEGLMKE